MNAGLCVGPCCVQLGHHPSTSHLDDVHGGWGLDSPFSLHEILGRNMVLMQGECCKGVSCS